MPQVRIFNLLVNPGPFTIKEHVRLSLSCVYGLLTLFKVLVTVMAGVGAQAAYAVSFFFIPSL